MVAMYPRSRKIIGVLCGIVMIFWACKKEVAPAGERLLEDIYSIMTTRYLWADYVRNQGVNPNSFSDPGLLITAARSPEDKFTFLIPRSRENELKGLPTDVGLLLRYLDDTLYIAYVAANSPATEKGLTRGLWVKELQVGDNAVRVLTPPPDDLNPRLRPTSSSPYSVSLGGNMLKMKYGTRGSDVLQEVTLHAVEYQEIGINHMRVLDIAGRRVGYFEFNSFISQNASKELEDAFKNFITQGVQDLVIDLRYNSGGYLSVAERLLNHIHTAQNTDELLYYLQYNDRRDDEYFTPNFPNSLNPKRCYFLVSAQTASASELTINSLQAVDNIEVHVIGRSTTGKNVGSIGLSVPGGSDYSHIFYPIVFRIYNARDVTYGDDGVLPQYQQVFDDVHRPLGDARESMLAAALYHVEHGDYPNISPTARLLEQPEVLLTTRSRRDLLIAD